MPSFGWGSNWRRRTDVLLCVLCASVVKSRFTTEAQRAQRMEKGSIVERRLRYIERQQKLGHGVNVRFEGLNPQGSGPPNRHGLPKIPIDQHVVQNWPVLNLGESPGIALSDWRLEVAGLVENPLTLTWTDFMALPQVEDVSDFHCVTTWSRLDNRRRGVQFNTIA